MSDNIIGANYFINLDSTNDCSNVAKLKSVVINTFPEISDINNSFFFSILYQKVKYQSFFRKFTENDFINIIFNNLKEGL